MAANRTGRLPAQNWDNVICISDDEEREVNDNESTCVVSIKTESLNASLEADLCNNSEDLMCINCTKSFRDLNEIEAHLFQNCACFYPLTKSYWHEKILKKHVCTKCQTQLPDKLMLKRHCFEDIECRKYFIDVYTTNIKQQWERSTSSHTSNQGKMESSYSNLPTHNSSSSLINSNTPAIMPQMCNETCDALLLTGENVESSHSTLLTYNRNNYVVSDNTPDVMSETSNGAVLLKEKETPSQGQLTKAAPAQIFRDSSQNEAKATYSKSTASTSATKDRLFNKKQPGVEISRKQPTLLSCNVCNRKFSGVRNLEDHKDRMHSENTVPNGARIASASTEINVDSSNSNVTTDNNKDYIVNSATQALMPGMNNGTSVNSLSTTDEIHFEDQSIKTAPVLSVGNSPQRESKVHNIVMHNDISKPNPSQIEQEQINQADLLICVKCDKLLKSRTDVEGHQCGNKRFLLYSWYKQAIWEKGKYLCKCCGVNHFQRTYDLERHMRCHERGKKSRFRSVNSSSKKNKIPHGDSLGATNEFAPQINKSCRLDNQETTAMSSTETVVRKTNCSSSAIPNRKTKSKLAILSKNKRVKKLRQVYKCKNCKQIKHNAEKFKTHVLNKANCLAYYEHPRNRGPHNLPYCFKCKELFENCNKRRKHDCRGVVNQSFKCALCEKTYSTTVSLKNHYKRAHNRNMNSEYSEENNNFSSNV